MKPLQNILINDCDTELFKELVDNDSFLFDFVKDNVAQRIAKEINENNYKKFNQIFKILFSVL